MKNTILLLALLSTPFLLAQPQKMPPKEKVERYKVQFITEKLNLTTSEAQSFWPVYNEYTAELEKIQSNRRSDFIRHRHAGSAFADMDDAAIEEMVMEELNRLTQIAELKKLYFPKFKMALGTRKAALYYKTEVEFHQHLMKRLSERKRK